MSTQQVPSKTEQVPQQQLGKEDVKSKGKTEATESVSSQQQEQKVELRGKQYPKSHLEEKDIQCMLKMSDGCAYKETWFNFVDSLTPLPDLLCTTCHL
jgi:hypothetical protein